MAGRGQESHRSGDTVRLGKGVGEHERTRLVRQLAASEQLAPELALQLADTDPRLGVMTHGADEGRLDRAGEEQRSKSMAERRQSVELERAAPRTVRQTARDERGGGDDAVVALGSVVPSVEQRGHLRVEERRQRATRRPVGVQRERPDSMGELHARSVLAVHRCRGRRRPSPGTPRPVAPVASVHVVAMSRAP